MKPPIFHIAVPVDDIHRARAFYLDTLGCRERADTSDDGFLVLDFFGAQLVLSEPAESVPSGRVGAGIPPYRHFGLILDWDDWQQLGDDLTAKGIPFHIEPNIKDHPGIGKVGGLFITDPAGNYLEFKSYRDPSRIF